MGAFFTVSYWITLVTVLPGLVTIATVYGGVAFVSDGESDTLHAALMGLSDWILVPIFISIIILNQAVGILVEEGLIRYRLLGRDKITPHSIKPYDQYGKLYFLLAKMSKDDDPHGHLRRTIAQFFLTVNTLVSFAAGMLTAVVIFLITGTSLTSAIGYSGIMLVCLIISYLVAIIRFREMARSIWASDRVTGEMNVDEELS